MRRFARADRDRLGFGQLDAHSREVGFGFGHTRGGRRLALACPFEPAPHGLDDLGQLAVLPRKQHLLPPAHFVAELPVPSRLGRLALEGSALLLHLEHDVVDTREVQLCGFELQLSGAAPRLVLGDARRFLDEHATVGRSRAQNQSDLALLDDGVGLGTEPRVHQKVVNIPQPARPTIDQILALARAIEPPGHLDIARDRPELLRLAVVAMAVAVGDVAVPVRRRVTMAIADRVVMVTVARLDRCVAVGPVAVTLSHEHAAEPQPDFRRSRRLPCVAAAEDDVFHPLAAQALGALLAHHPGDGVSDIALAAAVRPDNGRHAAIERQLGSIREGLEAVNL